MDAKLTGRGCNCGPPGREDACVESVEAGELVVVARQRSLWQHRQAAWPGLSSQERDDAIDIAGRIPADLQLPDHDLKRHPATLGSASAVGNQLD